MKKLIKAIYLSFSAPLLLLLTGCATIVSDTVQVMRVKSNPSGATVTADGIERGMTPTQFCLSRDTDHVVTIDLPGYKRYEIPIRRGVNGWFFGNILLFGPVGMIVDGVDGAIYVLDPDSININFEPIGTRWRDVGSTTPDGRVIVLASHPQKAGWKKIGQLARS